MFVLVVRYRYSLEKTEHKKLNLFISWLSPPIPVCIVCRTRLNTEALSVAVEWTGDMSQLQTP